MKNRVWVQGDAVVDLIPEDNERYLKCPGGAPANVAVAIARLGGNSAFIGRVGADPFGRFMQQVLSSEQVDSSSMILDPEHATSTVLVDLDEHGERSFHFLVNPSADQFLTQQDLPTFNAGEWLHLCSIALINEPARSAAMAAMVQIKAAGGWVSFDPNLRLDLWPQSSNWREVVLKAMALADIIKLSEEEVVLLTKQNSLEKGIASLSERLGPKQLLVTLGKEGTDWYVDGGCTRIPSRPTRPVDTTGAGDAFVGGLLYCLASTDNWQERSVMTDAIRTANACGALATTAKGAMTALPTAKQLSDYPL